METVDAATAEGVQPTPTEQNKGEMPPPNNRCGKITAAVVGLVVIILVVVLSVALTGNNGDPNTEVPTASDFTTGMSNEFSHS